MNELEPTQILVNKIDELKAIIIRLRDELCVERGVCPECFGDLKRFDECVRESTFSDNEDTREWLRKGGHKENCSKIPPKNE